MSQLTAVDLFSGAGGTSLGLKQAGFQVVAAIEMNPLAVESYNLNLSDVAVWERDIRDVSTDEVIRGIGLSPGQLSILAACPPCQGFSSIRTLNGSRMIEDQRNGLLVEVTRFVRDLKPLTVMMENVPGLSQEASFDEFLDELEILGYEPRSEIVDASDYGVPQRRRRLLVLASRLGSPPLGECVSTHRTVRDALCDLPTPGNSGDPLHDVTERRSLRIASMISRIPHDGGSRSALDADDQLGCHIRTDGFRDIYGRMAWDKVAPTLTGGCVNPSKGRFLHPDQDRAITLREAALLQSFPPSCQVSLSRGKHAAAELIGNALPPEFVRRHAFALRHHIQSSCNIGDLTTRGTE